jgi:hypothetical protein
MTDCNQCGEANRTVFHICSPELRFAKLLESHSHSSIIDGLLASAFLRRLHAKFEAMRMDAERISAQADASDKECARLEAQADRDTALLRQCLEALKPWAGLSHTKLIADLRERLEGNK